MHKGQVKGSLDDPVDDPVHHHVRLKLSFDVGFLDFDGYFATVFEGCFMDLG